MHIDERTTRLKKEKAATGTQEWAQENANIIDGCVHGCIYCYAREMADRFHRVKTEDWHKESVRTKRKKSYPKLAGGYMFPTTHDISVKNLAECIIEIEKILKPGNEILIVTKPHLHCIKEICRRFPAYKDKILFRFSIGSVDDKVLKFWEPYAPKYAERLASLKWAYDQGYRTSVSCEPMLDDKIDKVIEDVLPHVTDSIWVGKANRLRLRLSVNGFDAAEYRSAAEQLIRWQSDDNIKKLYNRYKDNSKIKWKESIKLVVGLDMLKVGEVSIN